MTDKNEPPAAASKLRIALCVALATVCGCGVSVQSRINGQLGTDLGDGFIAALISFGSGLVIVTVILVAMPSGRRGFNTVRNAIRTRQIPWWHAAGGAAGGLFVLSQGLVVGLLGIALFTVASVAGQTISGLFIDSRGIGTVAPKAITVGRIAGASLALVAVVIAVLPQLGGHAHIWVIVLPFLVGLCLSWQQAVNGQIKTLSRSATTATFFNFVAGTVLLAIFAAINLALAGLPHGFPTNPLLYAGGLIGVLFIAGFAFVIPIIGVLLQSLAAIGGQLLMALLLDVVAPTDTAGIAVATVVGTLLTLVAVVIASIRSRVLIRPSTGSGTGGSV
jgi:transporter family-2 protein